MKNNHLTEEDIAQAAEALQANTYKSLAKEIKNHLAECDACADEVQMVSALITDADIATRPKLHKSFLKITMAVAASAVLFIISLHLLKQNETEAPALVENALPQNNNLAIDSAHSPSIEGTKSEKMPLAELPEEENFNVKNITPIKTVTKGQGQLAYVSNAEMEELVQRFEESALRGGGLKVISSSTIEDEADYITLCWENPNHEEVILEFFSNTGTKISESSSDGNSYHPEFENAGLYYWKMLNEDFDLVFCGRIIVK